MRLVMETHESVLLVPKDAVIEENARTYVFLARSQEPGEASAEEARPAPAGDGLQEAGQDDPPENTDADNAANGQGSTSEPPNATSGQHWIAERVEVEVGLEDSDESEIVAGLSESDLVITLGQQTLKPGTRISITTAEKELAKSAGLSAEEALKVCRIAECEVAVLSAEGMDEMLTSEPGLAANLIAVLARKLSLRLRVVSARLSDKK